MVQRYLCKFYYIGAKKFHGSQRQKQLVTIEYCVIKALKEKGYIKNITDSKINFASRTDRYVSARGAAFSFNSEKNIYLMEINSILPKEIGLWAYAKVPQEFFSRFNAKYRHYKYIVHEPLSLLENRYFIDLDKVRKACKSLESSHDFTNFSKKEKHEIKTVRVLDHVNMSLVNDYIIFDFKSRAYLRQQIRRMVKKILQLGLSKIDHDAFLELFNTSKNQSYQPADPTGLILWDIKFDNNINFIIDPKSKKRMINYFFEQELEFRHKQQLFKVLQQNNLT